MIEEKEEKEEKQTEVNNMNGSGLTILGLSIEKPVELSPVSNLSLSRALSLKRAPVFFAKLPKKEQEYIKEALESKDIKVGFNYPKFVNDRNAKLIDVDETEDTLLQYFQKIISERRNNEDIKSYIEYVSNQEDRTIREGIDISKGTPIFLLLIKNIAKEICGKTGKKEELRISNAIDSLCNKVHYLSYKSKNGTTRLYTTHLISIKNSLRSPEDNILIQADFRFNDVFYNRLDTYFTKQPTNLLEIRRKYAGNEVYRLLWNILLVNYRRIAVIGVSIAEKKALKEGKALKINNLPEYIQKAQDKANVFDIGIDSIRDRLKQEYDSKKKGRFIQHIENAIEGLKATGIITDGRIDESKGREGKIYFKFNLSYEAPEDKNAIFQDTTEDIEEEA